MNEFIEFVGYIFSFILYIYIFGNVFVAFLLLLITWGIMAFIKKNAKKNIKKDND